MWLVIPCPSAPENLDEYRRLGYRGDERVGADGIEAWAEDYLAGKHGGTLYVVNPTTGQIVTKVGESAAKAADSVYLTIDRNLQKNAQDAIKGFTGAVVVLERDTGRVLAMASSPGFDSNMFSPDNPNAGAQYAALNESFSSPLLNRATRDSIRSARCSRSSPWPPAWKADCSRLRQPSTASMIGRNYPIRSVTTGPGSTARTGWHRAGNAILPTAPHPDC